MIMRVGLNPRKKWNSRPASRLGLASSFVSFVYAMSNWIRILGSEGLVAAASGEIPAAVSAGAASTVAAAAQTRKEILATEAAERRDFISPTSDVHPKSTAERES